MTRRSVRSRRPLEGLLRPHRGRLLLGALCAGATAVAGGLYAYLTGPLLSLVLTGGARGREPFLQLVPATLREALPTTGTLALVAAFLVGLALVKGGAQLGQTYLLDGTAERVAHALRTRLFDHLVRLPFGVHARLSSGDLLVRLVDDVQKVQSAVLGPRLTLLKEGLAALALLAVALRVAPGLAAVTLLLVPAVGLGVGLLARRVKRSSAEGQSALGALAARAHGSLAAIQEVKSCGAEERVSRAIADASRGALRSALERVRLRGLGPWLNEVAAALGLAAALLWAGTQVRRGALAPESLVSFVTAVLLLYRPLKSLGQAWHQLAAGRASLDRLAELLGLPAEEGGDAQHEPGLPPLRRALEARELVFAYADGPSVLQGVSLELRAGALLALAGPSGAGKSTLVHLLAGLERPGGGSLTWDDLPLGEVSLAALRARVGLVPQRPLLLDGTLAENLRFGAPHADDEELRAALGAAGLRDWIARLPEGLATRLGAGGQGLSGGELQRLALARALLRRPSVLLLDEPSSALDEEHERALIETVRALARERAVLVVSHRASLLERADEVLWIEEGRLRRRGPPRGAAALGEEARGSPE